MTEKFTLGDWLVDPNENTLTNELKTISIEPKAMALLCMLCEANGEVVSREKIMQRLWNDRYVTEYALNNLVSSLRKYLSSESSKDSYIKTRPKMGYQLVAPVKRSDSGDELAELHESLSVEKVITTTNEQQISTTSSDTKNKSWILAALMFVALSLIVIWFVNTRQTEIPQVEPSIAVLPFEVIESGDTKDSLDFFAFGLANEIIHQLNAVDNFKVISRRSSFTYANRTINIQQIAQELSVNYILEGSVRREQELIRTTIQLVRASDESILWSRVFTASKTNNFSIQHEISDDIARSMDASFIQFPEQSLVYQPQSSEAYLHVLRGRKLNQTGGTESYLKARDEFLMATLLDPKYTMAYVDLGISYLLLQQTKALGDEEASKFFLEAINKALELNPNFPEAHAAFGIYYYNKQDFDGARTSFEKALNQNPKLYLALLNYANLLRAYHYPEESLELYKRAYEIAPLSDAVNWGIGQTNSSLGRFEESIASYENCVNRSKNSQLCYMGLAYAYRLNMQDEKADATLEQLSSIASKDDYYYNLVLAWHALQTNDSARANEIMNALFAKHGYTIPLQTMTYAKLGIGKQKEWLEQLSKVENPGRQRTAFKANLAHAAYFNNECELAIEFYESILRDQPTLAENLDLMANGVTYVANLAYCYTALNNAEMAKEKVEQLQDILKSLDDGQRALISFTYSEAQYAVLTGDVERAQQAMQKVKNSKWGVKWLLQKDPIFIHLLSNLQSN